MKRGFQIFTHKGMINGESAGRQYLLLLKNKI